MDYEARLLDERLIGEEKGRQEGRQEGRIEGEKIGEEKGIKKGARNVIIEFKANQAAPSFIFQFVKNAYKGKLTDEEIQQMIDDVEENEYVVSSAFNNELRESRFRKEARTDGLRNKTSRRT